MLICSLAEELVTAAQAVESGKGLERKLSTLQIEYTQVNFLTYLYSKGCFRKERAILNNKVDCLQMHSYGVHRLAYSS